MTAAALQIAPPITTEADDTAAAANADSSAPPCDCCGRPGRHGKYPWCKSCYDRWRYHGRPEAGPPPPDPTRKPNSHRRKPRARCHRGHSRAGLRPGASCPACKRQDRKRARPALRSQRRAEFDVKHQGHDIRTRIDGIRYCATCIRGNRRDTCVRNHSRAGLAPGAPCPACVAPYADVRRKRHQAEFARQHDGHEVRERSNGATYCFTCAVAASTTTTTDPLDEAEVDRAVAGRPSRKLTRSERDLAATRLRLTGLTYARIGECLGCTLQQAQVAVRRQVRTGRCLRNHPSRQAPPDTACPTCTPILATLFTGPRYPTTTPVDEDEVERAMAGEPTRKLTRSELALAATRLKLGGLSYTQIAKRLNCTYNTGRRAVRRQILAAKNATPAPSRSLSPDIESTIALRATFTVCANSDSPAAAAALLDILGLDADQALATLAQPASS